MITPSESSLIVVREDERGYAAAAHFLGAIPLWGLLMLAGVWIYFKERSREIVFHVQQAMMFQTVLLGIFVVWLAVALIAKIVGVLQTGVAEFISLANQFFLISFYCIYAAVCVVGGCFTFAGKPFLYPVLGRRVLQGNVSKINEQEV